MGFALNFLILKSAITITFAILNCIWLLKIMENSKKEEAFVKIDDSQMISSEDPNGVCEKYLYNYLDKGAHETFNFKMKDINKFSIGLISLLFIQLGMDSLYYII